MLISSCFSPIFTTKTLVDLGLGRSAATPEWSQRRAARITRRCSSHRKPNRFLLFYHRIPLGYLILPMAIYWYIGISYIGVSIGIWVLDCKNRIGIQYTYTYAIVMYCPVRWYLLGYLNLPMGIYWYVGILFRYCGWLRNPASPKGWLKHVETYK